MSGGAATAAERRTVTLGADTWQVLVHAAEGLDLPAPFSLASTAVLTPAQHGAATEALRASALVSGTSGGLIADLHPAAQASLALHAAPQLVIEGSLGLGHELTAVRAALSGPLASILTREQHAIDAPTRADAPVPTELGPVTWTTAPAQLLATLVAELFGALPEHDDAPVQLDGATAIAACRALQAGRDAVAAQLVGGEPPSVLVDATTGLERAAKIDVVAAGRRDVLLAARANGRWWQLGVAGDDITFHPLGASILIAQLAAAIAPALISGGAP